MSWSLEAALAQPAGIPLAGWLGALFVAYVLGRMLKRSIWKGRMVDIRGRISHIARGNVIQLNVGELRKVEVGQIFTVYKRLALRIVSDETDTGPHRVRYTPVGQAKVISTTAATALCKFRPLKGYSYNPMVGDAAYYTSRVRVGKVVDLHAA